MAAYYNEFDKNAAAWLRELIRRDLIAPGDVDERSIVDVAPDDLRGYTQCHFFAGIGIWSYAARRAGWPDDRPLWTGSPPCQPFSAAGKGLGTADERHLWPAFFHLIDVGRPDEFFGEQVASKDALAWLDHVSADVEGAGYAFGAFDLCAAGFGAPHIRQRLKFVGTRALADPVRTGLEGHSRHGDDRRQPGRLGAISGGSVAALGTDGGLSLPDDPFWRANLSRGDVDDGADAGRSEGPGDARTGGAGGGMADDTGGGRREERPHGGGRAIGDSAQRLPAGSVDGVSYCGMGDPDGGVAWGSRSLQSGGQYGLVAEDAGIGDGHLWPGPTNGLWGDADWLLCRDGKWRPVEPGTFPLAHGAAARVGRLRGYGNAIVAPAAAHFIASYLEAEADGFRCERQPTRGDALEPGGLMESDLGVLLG